MAWLNRGNRKQQLTKDLTYTSRGAITDIGYEYFIRDNRLTRFMVTGGSAPERIQALFAVLDACVGRLPVVALHAYDFALEEALAQAWDAHEGENEGELWITNSSNPVLEPFYGMAPMQVISVLKAVAVKLGYTPAAKFDSVVMAHLQILDMIEVPISLSGLFYLSQFANLGEFHDNIIEHAGHDEGAHIWAKLDADNAGPDSQFVLFRTVVTEFAHHAAQNGWNHDTGVETVNISQALTNTHTLSIALNPSYASLLLPYFAEELKATSYRPQLVIIDGIPIEDDDFRAFLASCPDTCTFAIVGDNALDCVSNGMDDHVERKIAERMETFAIFKHATAHAATKLSELIGKHDYVKVEKSMTRSHGLLFASSEHQRGMQTTTENRYKVMPEEIIDLEPGQALIFDTWDNAIVWHN